MPAVDVLLSYCRSGRGTGLTGQSQTVVKRRWFRRLWPVENIMLLLRVIWSTIPRQYLGFYGMESPPFPVLGVDDGSLSFTEAAGTDFPLFYWRWEIVAAFSCKNQYQAARLAVWFPCFDTKYILCACECVLNWLYISSADLIKKGLFHKLWRCYFLFAPLQFLRKNRDRQSVVVKVRFFVCKVAGDPVCVPRKRFKETYWSHHPQTWHGDCLRHAVASRVNYIDLDLHSRSQIMKLVNVWLFQKLFKQ